MPDSLLRAPSPLLLDMLGGGTPANARLAENSDLRVAENGDSRVTEET